MFHPESKTVWSDLESSIEVIVPQKAEQPDNLKVKLLPFQQESLYWMREQERSVWSGGLLAVSSYTINFNVVANTFW